MTLIRPFLVWLALLGVIFGFAFRTRISGAREVLAHPATTMGTVVGLYPQEHRLVEVAYEVNGRSYKTSTSLPQTIGLPPFEDLRTGDQLRVTYSSEDPSEGVLGNPEKVLSESLKDLEVIAVFLLMPVIIFEIRFRRWLRRHNRAAIADG